MMGYALLFWLPSFFVRSFGITLLDASFFYAAIILIGGLAGLWLGGWLADHYGQRNRAAYAMIPAIAFLVTAPMYVAGVLSTSLTLTFVLMLVPTALGMLWLGPVIAAIQHLVRPNMRTTASAVFLFINNLIGIGAGTVVIGMLSDELHGRYGDDALKYSILAGTSLYLVAAGLLFIAARFLARDWED
jgi:nitrate/nitrite transporter NarK